MFIPKGKLAAKKMPAVFGDRHLRFVRALFLRVNIQFFGLVAVLVVRLSVVGVWRRCQRTRAKPTIIIFLLEDAFLLVLRLHGLGVLWVEEKPDNPTE